MSLAPHPTLPRRKGPIVLCILDGVGLGAGGEDDAVASADTPTIDRLLAENPWCKLAAHGVAVGLPSDGDMGNSEVGHNAMGAGRVFDQGAKLVDKAIASGAAWRSPVWANLTEGQTLHLLGLTSAGNVHSHTDHLHALIEQAARDGVTRLRLHVLTDGRDVSARSALTWVKPLEDRMAQHRGAGRDFRIASGGGRMHITMDRYEADWAMVERGWRCHVQGDARAFASASEAIQTLYDEDPDVDDQRLPAFVVTQDGEPVGRIQDGDSVLFFNFRGDRAIEISRAFEDDDFPYFERPNRPNVYYAGMMQYDGDTQVPANYLVSPPDIDRPVAEYLSKAGRRSFACSETQKFGHVTYFFNGNNSGRPEGEEWEEVPSDNVPFDQRPWMKAAEVTDAVIAALGKGYDHIRLNYANGDMVGHTGDLEATRVAMVCVDHQLGRLEAAVRKVNGVLLVTADHGNADEMYMRKKGRLLTGDDGTPLPRTSHTLSPVFFIVVDPERKLTVATEEAGLAAVGTTILELCGLQAPEDYVSGLVVPVQE